MPVVDVWRKFIADLGKYDIRNYGLVVGELGK